MKVFFWVCFFALVIGPLIFGKMIQFTSSNWKIVEFVTILVGAIGIVPLIIDANKIESRNRLPIILQQTKSWIPVISYSVKVDATIIDDRLKRHELEGNLVNHAEYILMKDWYLELRNQLKSDELPDLTEYLKIDALKLRNAELINFEKDIKGSIKKYQDGREKYQNIKSKVGPLDDILIFFLPLFISLAIGLSLMKVLYQ